MSTAAKTETSQNNGPAVNDGADNAGKKFFVNIEGRDLPWDRDTITTEQIAQLGGWDVAPRSHPNDGVVDVLVISMGLGDRMKARKRLATGTHVPHPFIAQRRVSTAEFRLRPTKIWLDGELVTTLTDFIITVEPDALTIVL